MRSLRALRLTCAVSKFNSVRVVNCSKNHIQQGIVGSLSIPVSISVSTAKFLYSHHSNSRMMSTSTLSASKVKEDESQDPTTKEEEEETDQLQANFTQFIRNGVHTLASSPIPTSTLKVHVDTNNQFLSSNVSDVVGVFVTKDRYANLKQTLDYVCEHALGGIIKASDLPSENSASWKDFKGNASQSLLVYTQSEKVPRLLFFGLGNSNNVTTLTMRTATHKFVQYCKTKKFANAALIYPDIKNAENSTSSNGQNEDDLDPFASPSISGLSSAEVIDLLTRISLLSNHSFQKYMKKPSFFLENITILLPESSSTISINDAKEVVASATIVSECTILARELGNERADVAHPEEMEKIARTVADTHHLKITVLHEDDLRANDLHLLASVGQAARHKPRLVLLEYKGDPSAEKEKLAFVGKGITFDSGGLNLKGTGHMEDMHLDKCGAVAVLSAIKAISVLKLKVNVVAVLALAENAIDALSYKPHAIIPTSKGTVEIANTDAEGRLALADALVYVQRTHSPHTILDFATLTGACIVALGECAAGTFSRHTSLNTKFQACGSRVAERLWPMPLLPEYTEDLKTTYADMRSSAGRYGGAGVAAAFLSTFVDRKVHWLHCDLAGPAMYSKARDWVPKGSTGFAVQSMVEYAKSLEKPS